MPTKPELIASKLPQSERVKRGRAVKEGAKGVIKELCYAIGVKLATDGRGYILHAAVKGVKNTPVVPMLKALGVETVGTCAYGVINATVDNYSATNSNSFEETLQVVLPDQASGLTGEIKDNH